MVRSMIKKLIIIICGLGFAGLSLGMDNPNSGHGNNSSCLSSQVSDEKSTESLEDWQARMACLRVAACLFNVKSIERNIRCDKSHEFDCVIHELLYSVTVAGLRNNAHKVQGVLEFCTGHDAFFEAKNYKLLQTRINACQEACEDDVASYQVIAQGGIDDPVLKSKLKQAQEEQAIFQAIFKQLSDKLAAALNSAVNAGSCSSSSSAESRPSVPQPTAPLLPNPSSVASDDKPYRFLGLSLQHISSWVSSSYAKFAGVVLVCCVLYKYFGFNVGSDGEDIEVTDLGAI